ncbi:SHOCT domain-containing protein [Hymenobacter daeguensis]
MDNNPSSPLDTLRQLKEMLDAGALTPAEFEALKQRLVLNPGTPLPPGAAAVPMAPAPVVPPVVLPPAPVAEQHSPMFEDVADEAKAARPTPSAPLGASAAPAFPAAETSLLPTEAAPDPAAEAKWTGDEFPAIAEEAPARNPLALVMSIGGVLVFLAVVAYLTLNRPPSEHISSTSQTAADSLATTIDAGPQAAPLPAPVAAPETIRVAPAHPAPAIPVRPAPAADSVAPSTSPAADSAI